MEQTEAVQDSHIPEAQDQSMAQTLDSHALANLRELLGVFAAFNDVVTADTVQGMVRFTAGLGEIADRVNRPEMLELVDAAANAGADLTRLVQRVARMEHSGMLDRIEQILLLVNAALDVVTPDIIASLAKTAARFMELADTFMQSGMTRGLPDALAEWDLMLKNMKDLPDPKAGSLRQLLGTLRDPDVRVGIAVGLQVVRQFGAGMRKEAQSTVRPLKGAD